MGKHDVHRYVMTLDDAKKLAIEMGFSERFDEHVINFKLPSGETVKIIRIFPEDSTNNPEGYGFVDDGSNTSWEFFEKAYEISYSDRIDLMVLHDYNDNFIQDFSKLLQRAYEQQIII